MYTRKSWFFTSRNFIRNISRNNRKNNGESKEVLIVGGVGCKFYDVRVIYKYR